VFSRCHIIDDRALNRLWGVACAQAWHYYQHFPSDSRFLKWYVFAALALDTAHQALTIRARKHDYFLFHIVCTQLTAGRLVWFYVVTNYVNPLALLSNPWSYVVQLVPGEIASFLVQNFFIYRVYICVSTYSPSRSMVFRSADWGVLSEQREVVAHRSADCDEPLNSGPYPILCLL
jgi:hypothetical protein